MSVIELTKVNGAAKPRVGHKAVSINRHLIAFVGGRFSGMSLISNIDVLDLRTCSWFSKPIRSQFFAREEISIVTLYKVFILCNLFVQLKNVFCKKKKSSLATFVGFWWISFLH